MSPSSAPANEPQAQSVQGTLSGSKPEQAAEHAL